MVRTHTIDLPFQGQAQVIAAYLQECGDEFALIETGPGSTLPSLLDGINRLGVSPDRIGHVFLIHIHLDHAGAAGWWARQGAKVFCHPLAVKHLVDPARLLASARMVYGEAMDSLWGEMLPAPAERIHLLPDEATVNIGGVSITAWETPGHARHHLAYVIGDTCFTGDVAGVRLAASPYVSITSAPPQFDHATYLESIDRLMAARFDTLHLTHFGLISDVEAHLASYRRRVIEVYQRVGAWCREGVDESYIRKRHRALEHDLAMKCGLSTDLWAKYECANGSEMCADGLRLACSKAE